jgi:hypothetical protein
MLLKQIKATIAYIDDQTQHTAILSAGDVRILHNQPRLRYCKGYGDQCTYPDIHELNKEMMFIISNDAHKALQTIIWNMINARYRIPRRYAQTC